MQKFWESNKEHYGMLWYFLEWSIELENDTDASGAPNEKMIQNHLNIALLNVF